MPSSRKNAAASAAADGGTLLLAERHAVSALIHGGVLLVGAHADLIQGAVVLIIAVMGTLVDGAFNGLVGVIVHNKSSLNLGSALV